MGIAISIDDLVTGYSSLNPLSTLPVDFLKIDNSFIADIITNTGTASIAESTINLAHSLDIPIIAEGVSTHEQLEFLVNHSRALSPHELDIFEIQFKPSCPGLSFQKHPLHELLKSATVYALCLMHSRKNRKKLLYIIQDMPGISQRCIRTGIHLQKSSIPFQLQGVQI